MALEKIRTALDNALLSIAGIIPSVAISGSTAATPSVFTTATPHLLPDGLGITIANHSTINGVFNVDVIDANNFTLKDSKTQAVIGSLAVGSGGTVLANLTAWENMNFKSPPPNVPFQKVDLLPAQPDNNTLGSGHYREVGIYQITLMYPAGVGPGAAAARAELIRSTFSRGASFSYIGITVRLDRTAQIMTPQIEQETYKLPIQISYWADIFN